MVECSMTPTNKEVQLLEYLRKLGWGEVKILVQNGEPVLIYESIKSMRLDDDDETAGRPGVSSKNGLRRSTIELFK